MPITHAKHGDCLPMTRDDMHRRRWNQLDVLLVTGDAYIDHPSHGAAMIGRVLEAAGYRVGIIARPNWTKKNAMNTMGRPRLFAGVTGGAVDSTLNNYTADLSRRKNDAYVPACDNSRRPNMATAVYCQALKATFPGLPIVLGGIEASVRRFAYFDYLKKRIRRSILVDTRADILVFGPGETQALSIARRLNTHRSLDGIDGTVRRQKHPPTNAIELPPFDDIAHDTSHLLEQTRLLEEGLGPHRVTTFFQRYQEGIVVSHPPSVQTTAHLDRFHALAFTRQAHPVYREPIPALETVRHSIIAVRGCPGGCSFCSIAYHQGRHPVSRSSNAILDEIKSLRKDATFKGVVTDIGGPTANVYGCGPIDPARCSVCKRPSCLHPHICPNFNADQTAFSNLLSRARNAEGIRHVFVASGIRHDLAIHHPTFMKNLAAHHIGGHLKAAPEHCDATVLKLMRKPPIHVFEQFEQIWRNYSRQCQKEQYVVPYFIAGFPGCDAIAGNAAGSWLRQRQQRLQQVQTFIPLPGTMAAAMYACGRTADGIPVTIPDPAERKRQKQLLTNPSFHGRVSTRNPAVHRAAQKHETNQTTAARRHVHASRPGSGSKGRLRRRSPRRGHHR